MILSLRAMIRVQVCQGDVRRLVCFMMFQNDSLTLVLGVIQVLPAHLSSSMRPMKMRNPAVFQEHASTTHRAGCLVYPLIRTVRGKWCWLVSLGCW